MYALKPIITHSEALKRNVCMYEMKNIYDGRRNDNVDQASNSNVVDNISEQVINFLKVLKPSFMLLGYYEKN